MKKKLKDIDFSTLPADKIGLILLVNLYEIRTSLQLCLEEVQSLNEVLKNESSKVKIKPSINSSIAESIKRLKELSSVISKIHSPNITDEELKSFYEMQKILSKIPKENVENFTDKFFDFFTLTPVPSKEENKKKSGS